MSASAKEKLLSLLCSGENRELVNVKFFPGYKVGLRTEEMCAEAVAALEDVFARDIIEDRPPAKIGEKVPAKDLLPKA